jgi:hypothetical protein
VGLFLMMTRTNAGAAAAWVDTVEAFGSGKLSVAEVLEPAIRLATEGYKPDCFCHHRRASASLIFLIIEYRVPISEIHSVAVRTDTIRLAGQTSLNHEPSGDVGRTF